MNTQPRTENPCPVTAEDTVRPARRSRLVGFAVAALTTVGLVCGFIQPASANTPAQIANLVIHEINVERSANHLPILQSSYRLNASAWNHNGVMSRHNTLSHQIPGEASLGARISQTSFPWSYCAENIAWTSSVSTPGALAVHRSMYGEHAPNDGHRLNILSRSINYVGVNVMIDTAHRKLWITEDFAKLA